MVDVVPIAGSPAAASRSAAILERTRDRLAARGLRSAAITVRDLHPEELVWGRIDGPSVQGALALIEQARGVVIATPVYKAAYSGVLKAFLDLLPNGVLAGKVVLPIATAGSLAHCLALEYALKPVLSALGARHVLAGVCVLDSDFARQADLSPRLEDAADERLGTALDDLVAGLGVAGGVFALQEVAG
jgi:FMN reductase